MSGEPTLPAKEEDTQKSAIFALAERYAPQEDSFDICLAKGDILSFRNVQDATEIKRMHTEALAFAELASKSTLPQHKPFKGLDRETLARVSCLAFMCANDDFGKKWSEKAESYAYLAKKAGFLFREIYTKVDLKSLNYEYAQAGVKIENAKKNSEAETSNESS